MICVAVLACADFWLSKESLFAHKDVVKPLFFNPVAPRLSLNWFYFLYVSDPEDQPYCNWEGTNPALQAIRVRKDTFHNEPLVALASSAGAVPETMVTATTCKNAEERECCSPENKNI